MNRLAYLLLPLLAASGTTLHNSAHSATDAAWAAVPARDAISLRPVRWSVIGGSSAREVVSGRTVPITLQADIAKGWHIYSLTQKSGGPIPLRLQLLGAADVLVRGVVKAPKPERQFDKNFGIETELYSGSPRFTIPIGVPGRSLSGIRKFQIGARYQVCSDKVCLPPRTDSLNVAIRIVGRK
ncbi:MAG TPA: protein-disulfide reductase DsbD N-terminal domain-containing protein [Gemmatimonadaceae bacterium]